MTYFRYKILQSFLRVWIPNILVIFWDNIFPFGHLSLEMRRVEASLILRPQLGLNSTSVQEEITTILFCVYGLLNVFSIELATIGILKASFEHPQSLRWMLDMYLRSTTKVFFYRLHLNTFINQIRAQQLPGGSI